MKNIYACLQCGTVENYKLQKGSWRRKEQKDIGPGPGGFSVAGRPPAIVTEHYFVCKHCNEKQIMKTDVEEL